MFGCEKTKYVRESMLKYGGLDESLHPHILICPTCQEAMEEIEENEKMFD